jgi:hypothetical protein
MSLIRELRFDWLNVSRVGSRRLLSLPSGPKNTLGITRRSSYVAGVGMSYEKNKESTEYQFFMMG